MWFFMHSLLILANFEEKKYMCEWQGREIVSEQ